KEFWNVLRECPALQEIRQAGVDGVSLPIWHITRCRGRRCGVRELVGERHVEQSAYALKGGQFDRRWDRLDDYGHSRTHQRIRQPGRAGRRLQLTGSNFREDHAATSLIGQWTRTGNCLL